MMTKDSKPSIEIRKWLYGWQYAIDGVWDNRLCASADDAEGWAWRELRSRGLSDEQIRSARWKSSTPLNY